MLISCSTFRTHDDIVVIGERSWSKWLEESKWDLKEYYAFKPSDEQIAVLSKLIIKKNPQIVIGAQSFCDECRSEVPKIVRILIDAGLREQNILIIGYGKDITETEGIKIKRFPFIYIKNAISTNKHIISDVNDWGKSLIELFNQ